ncbi:unnamed protein product [Phaedon cochleariae]|uniref:HSF-type DNA-binding domain-containing protein n=1 Tax=Phaedon cochleariae TaxID=80249 RepID=A0A9N9SBM9_PHACE|nr:unnamed protein product [Phaedon cochleariae]
MQPLGENTSNIPAFLGKLWKMVNDPNTDHLISWSPAGNSFIIQNQAQFWYELLPLYYKHNNMSSFVRQLNMYGFHKISTVENGAMDSDKDEIQFYHRYFQKDQPELLNNIKRKVTTSKSENGMQNVIKTDDIAKVLSDVKHLHGRQSSVDSQLSAIKQENAVLWRELAMLRQKHMKQQQIVNKLIQFLVTLVQPSNTSRMGVGVKRRIPLMIHEGPKQKSRKKKTVKTGGGNNENGPTIHELDSEIEIPQEGLFEQDLEESVTVSSPVTADSPLAPSGSPQSEIYQPNSVSSNESNSETGLPDSFWDKPEFVEISQINPAELITSEDDVAAEEGINSLQQKSGKTNESDIFMNRTSRDTLLSKIVNGTYNSNALNGKNGRKNNKTSAENASSSTDQKLTVATRDAAKINNSTLGTDVSRDELDLHLETTQSEIDQLKDILHGCNSLDANVLLGKNLFQLFNDDVPGFGLSCMHADSGEPIDPDSAETAGDPMVSGTELATCEGNLIDFNELFDDSLDGQDAADAEAAENNFSSSINTPLIVKSEPIFPTLDKDL